jgi:hypothetical protein
MWDHFGVVDHTHVPRRHRSYRSQVGTTPNPRLRGRQRREHVLPPAVAHSPAQGGQHQGRAVQRCRGQIEDLVLAHLRVAPGLVYPNSKWGNRLRFVGIQELLVVAVLAGVVGVGGEKVHGENKAPLPGLEVQYWRRRHCHHLHCHLRAEAPPEN